ncbi:metallophosphoesterase family protein [Chloroflexota bacterium]
MNILVIGDIHGNVEAFQAVLDHAGSQGFQQVWCLGDIVGYGPDPGACLDLLSGYSPLTVAGNHDLAAVGLLAMETFNYYAAEACRWTARNLSKSQKAYLQELPLVQTQETFTLVHGSLRDPVWEYLVHEEAAVANFQLLSTLCCLVAHSHIPFVCRENDQRTLFECLPEGVVVPLNRSRVVINPGSVGQPRDGDPRAAYILYDVDAGTIVLHRVSYDIPATQEKMARTGLPTPLIVRLAMGR